MYATSHYYKWYTCIPCSMLNVTFHKWNYIISNPNSMRTTYHRPECRMYYTRRKTTKYQNQQMSFVLFIPVLRGIFPPSFSNYEYKNTKRFTLWRPTISNQRSVMANIRRDVYINLNIHPIHFTIKKKIKKLKESKVKTDFYLFIYLLKLENIHKNKRWTLYTFI